MIDSVTLYVVVGAVIIIYLLKKLFQSERKYYDMLAIDCEMVGGYCGNSILARVSIVDSFGGIVYDTYVAPSEPIYSYRTQYSGITPYMLINAPSFEQVRKKVEYLVEGALWIGHSVEFDLAALKMVRLRRLICDVALHPKYLKNGQKQSLKVLAKKFLDIDIQENTHDSIEDATAALYLYKYARDNFLWY